MSQIKNQITQMTAEQAAHLPIYRAEWIAIGENTTQTKTDDVRAAVRGLYVATGLKEPKVIVMDSPFGCLVARALTANLGANLRTNLRANLWDNLGANLWDNLGANLGANLWTNLGANLWDNLGANLGANLWANLRADKIYDTASLWGGHDVGWLAHYDFPRSLGHIYPNAFAARLDATMKYAKLCGWLYAYDGIAFVSQRQCELHRDARGRLHSETRMAMAFADGYGFYAWHGIRVPAWCIERKSAVTKKAILGETNTEVRRAMCEIIGWPKALELIGGRVINRDECLGLPRELIEIDLNGEKARLLKMTNGTIENGERRQFIEGVPLTVNTCHEAMAWQIGIPAKIYNEGVRT